MLLTRCHNFRILFLVCVCLFFGVCGFCKWAFEGWVGGVWGRFGVVGGDADSLQAHSDSKL